MTALPANVSALLDAASDRYGVPRIYARAVAWTESQGRHDLQGTRGELGVMQLMPDTAAELGVNPRDLAANIDGGVRYLANMQRLYGERVGLAAYNGGPSIARKPESEWPSSVKSYLTRAMMRVDYEARTIGVRTAAPPFDLADLPDLTDEVTEDLSPLLASPRCSSSSTSGAASDDT